MILYLTSEKSQVVFVIFVYLPEEKLISIVKMMIFERPDILCSDTIGDNNRQISQCNQTNIHQYPHYSTITIDKWMYIDKIKM